MKTLKWDKKFISIEPILDFDLKIFIKWMEEIDPIIIYIGYDNYNNRLPEPKLTKTLKLIENLSPTSFIIKKTIRKAWNEGLEKYVKTKNTLIKSIDPKPKDPLEDFYKILRKKKIYVKEKDRLKPLSLQELAKHLYEKIILEKYPHKRDKIIFFTQHPGTIFKLFFIKTYLGFPYVRIISGLKNKLKEKYGYAEIMYIDLFAGSGITGIKIKDKEILLPGSAILPLIAQQRRKTVLFDRIILCEIDREKVKVLVDVIKSLLDMLEISERYKVKIIHNEMELRKTLLNVSKGKEIIVCKGDANRIGELIVQALEERDKLLKIGIHSLIFLDPGGPTEIGASLLKHLCSLPGDLFILFHPTIFAEMVLRKWSIDVITKKCAFTLELNENTAKSLKEKKINELEKLYMTEICNLIKNSRIRLINKPRTVILIPLKTRKRHYYLLYSIRKDYYEEFMKLKKEKKPIPIHLKWLENVIEKAKQFSKISSIGQIAIDMLEGKYTSITQQRLI